MTDKHTKIQDLKERLRGLRMGQPVIWAVINGYNTRLKIGLVTRLSPKDVDHELRKLVESQVLLHYYGKVYVLNKRGPNYEGYQELAKFSSLIEQKWAMDTPRPEVNRAWDMLSKEAQALVNAEKAEEKTHFELTQKQQEVWDQVSGWLEDHGRKGGPFTTREAAKAQGYEKAGFTKNLMLALVKKGRAEDLGGRPQTWRLIESTNPE